MLALGLAAALLSLSAPAKPDLGISALKVSPTSVTSAGHLTLRVRVRNAGKAGADASAVGFYLSFDRARGKDDQRIGARSVSRLRAGRSIPRSVRVQVPPAAGLFYVIACADDTREVRERNERNNCRASAEEIAITNG